MRAYSQRKFAIHDSSLPQRTCRQRTCLLPTQRRLTPAVPSFLEKLMPRSFCLSYCAGAPWATRVVSSLLLGLSVGCSGSPESSPTPDSSPSPGLTPTPGTEPTPTDAPTDAPTPTRPPQPTPPATPVATPTPTDAPTSTPANPTPTPGPTPDVSTYAALKQGLETPWLYEYETPGDGGVAHLTYWTLIRGSKAFLALPPEEQVKVLKIQLVNLASATQVVKEETPGVEVTGTLAVSGPDGERRQEVMLKLPYDWNGRLVVLATSGQFTEFSNETILSWWLVREGYAVVAGNKGMTNGGANGLDTLLNGQHPTVHWGAMALDLAHWAGARLSDTLGQPVAHTLIVGHSNGGYVVRKALELDHAAVVQGAERVFDGGVDWSGLFWPDARSLDLDQSGQVSSQEFEQGGTLFTMVDGAAQAMGYKYAEGSLTTTEAYYLSPPFAPAQNAMKIAGFTADSAPFWGIYNTLFEAYTLYGMDQFLGGGYYNVSGYLYRAELKGDTSETSLDYSCYATGDGSIPNYYAYLDAHPEGGWQPEDIEWALKNANSASFEVPLITVQGLKDGFIGVLNHGQAYADAVAKYGDPSLHRLYLVDNGVEIDADADGYLDFDLDGTWGEEGMASQLVPLQPYVQRAFQHLEAWVEEGIPAPASQTLHNDPAHDPMTANETGF